MDNLWNELPAILLSFAGRGVAVLLFVFAGWLALRFTTVPLRRFLERSRLDPTVASFLLNSMRSVLVIVVILGILQQLGMQTASLLTLLGTMGIAVALALQGSLANFA